MKAHVYNIVRKTIPINLKDIIPDISVRNNPENKILSYSIQNSLFFDKLIYEYFGYCEKVSIYKSEKLIFECTDGIIDRFDLFINENKINSDLLF